ncbi:aminoglycoside phosphotransferase [Haladaptatus sp. R4]|uniref:aminoglycoside phosphotransferase family protein n=1 Tax=Haladaptatus sp. R4 TaxID=1679489 RepID=UPI0007B4F678|nr:aminoglycoside phosphotransferase family protein [Haladaptatus sp. R4]KZN25250.1 aminoglycoside phosphotransferase [Haladaptatus sp. R4]
MQEDERDVRDVREKLVSHAKQYEVVRKLHDVPPHVTHEVRVDGKRAVYKRARSSDGNPAVEAEVIRHVARNTSVPVPEILGVGSDYFIAEWHDEVPEETSVDEERARAMGAGLATLHDETAFEATGFLRNDDGDLALDADETWHGTVCEFLASRREFVEPFGYGDVATDALEFVRKNPGLFDGAGDPVLCHGNFLPEHVGTDGDEVTCVIDFEHAIVAPGEYDYWRTALPIFTGPSGTNDALAEAFRIGYESVRSLPAGFDRRRELYWMVNAVSYFRSLFLQRQQTGQESARTARGFREYVYETIDSLETKP